eukprot:363929-Chlamydomonas_euryale.AAC.6
MSLRPPNPVPFPFFPVAIQPNPTPVPLPFFPAAIQPIPNPVSLPFFPAAIQPIPNPVSFRFLPAAIQPIPNPVSFPFFPAAIQPTPNPVSFRFLPAAVHPTHATRLVTTRAAGRNYDEYIASVDVQTEFVDSKSNHQRVKIKVTPYVFTGIDAIQIKGATLMPQKAVDAIVRSCLPSDPYRVDIGVMDKVRQKIEKWYQDRGLPFCYVGYFDGMEEGVMRANVIEAKINDVKVAYQRTKPSGADETEYEYYPEGRLVGADRVVQASGFRKGEHYHIDDGYDAMNNVYACGLFEDINIEPEQDLMDPSKINIKIRVDELEPRSMEMDLDWTLQVREGRALFGGGPLLGDADGGGRGPWRWTSTGRCRRRKRPCLVCPSVR